MMKKKLWILLIVLSLSLTGCLINRKKITFSSDNINITFHVKKDTNYKLSKKIEDFHSSREEAIILGKDFGIGIDISEEISYEDFKGDFNKLISHYKKSKDFKEITLSGIKGFQRYNSTYIRYEIYLPIPNNKEKVLVLGIYSKANLDEVTKEKYESDEVKDILNHITITYNKKDNNNEDKTKTEKKTK